MKKLMGYLQGRKMRPWTNVTFINNDSFHDRFIIIDCNIIYTCGASFKDLGKKCFYIGETSKDYIKQILNTINYKDK